jgi:hypothetical protein
LKTKGKRNMKRNIWHFDFLMKKNLICICIVGTLLSAPACYYDSEEELYGTAECNLSDITYTTAVLPIIDDNCYGCHKASVNSGNINLEGYTQLKKFVDNGQLLGSIKHESGFSAMPKNIAKLLDCEIAKIEAWVDAGALDN